MARRLTFVAPALVAAILSGCGYRAGYLTREGIDSVAVPVFKNDTFYRTIEVDLTRAVVTRIEKETPYRLTDSASADAVLEGKITGYRKTVLTVTVDSRAGVPRNTPTDEEVSITVEATLRNAKTGRVIARTVVREGDDFSGPLGETEDATRVLLYRRIAQRIVERTLERDW